MDVQHLELALRYAKTASDPVALTVLKDAVERFLIAQKRTFPPKPEPGNQNPTKWPDGLDDLVKRIHNNNRLTGCPACGAPSGVPHFCPGPRSPSTLPFGAGNIQYWLNQATAGESNGQRIGGQGISLGSGKGGSR